MPSLWRILWCGDFQPAPLGCTGVGLDMLDMLKDLKALPKATQSQ